MTDLLEKVGVFKLSNAKKEAQFTLFSQLFTLVPVLKIASEMSKKVDGTTDYLMLPKS
jgi:hypothetical protein